MSWHLETQFIHLPETLPIGGTAQEHVLQGQAVTVRLWWHKKGPWELAVTPTSWPCAKAEELN